MLRSWQNEKFSTSNSSEKHYTSPSRNSNEFQIHGYIEQHNNSFTRISMRFDPTNEIVQLCAEGMNLEGEDNGDQAAHLFMRAWHLAKNDYEKFIAAHYVARQQPSVTAKLEWDLAALDAASKVSGDEVKGAYPSLYLAIPQKYSKPSHPDVEVRNINELRNV